MENDGNGRKSQSKRDSRRSHSLTSDVSGLGSRNAAPFVPHFEIKMSSDLKKPHESISGKPIKVDEQGEESIEDRSAENLEEGKYRVKFHESSSPLQEENLASRLPNHEETKTSSTASRTPKRLSRRMEAPAAPAISINMANVTPTKAKRSKKRVQLDTPSTVASSPSDSVITFEHKHIYKRSKKSAALTLSKPLVGVACAVILALMGGGAFLLTDWFKIPILKAQIEDLTVQVDRLESQVNRLNEENEVFENLNENLQGQNDKFAAEIARFGNTNVLYAELNSELDSLNDRNQELIQMLSASNAKQAELKGELRETTDNLSAELNFLSEENERVTESSLLFKSQSEILSKEVERFSVANENLTAELKAMNSSFIDARKENDRLSVLNDDLRVIVTFLDETSGEIQSSYDDIANFLADQISAGQSIWTTSTQNIYRSRTNNLVCELQSRFSGKSFILDTKVPIGDENYIEVMNYFQEHFLSELCLDVDDFKTFLDMPPQEMSMNDLIRGTMRYKEEAMNYYFPKEDIFTRSATDSRGLNMTDWAIAQYQCENLPLDKRFISHSSRP